MNSEIYRGDFDENDVISREVLVDEGFRQRGATMYKVLFGEEIRFVHFNRNMYVYEGRFPHVQSYRELSIMEVEDEIRRSQ